MWVKDLNSLRKKIPFIWNNLKFMKNQINIKIKILLRIISRIIFFSADWLYLFILFYIIIIILLHKNTFHCVENLFFQLLVKLNSSVINILSTVWFSKQSSTWVFKRPIDLFWRLSGPHAMHDITYTPSHIHLYWSRDLLFK